MATITHTRGDTVPLTLALPQDASAATLQVHTATACIEIAGAVAGGSASFAPAALDALPPGRPYRTTVRVIRSVGVQTIPGVVVLVLEGCGDAPPAPPGLVLTGALVEAGADLASGAGSVIVSASGGMAEGGGDTASGSLSIVAPGAITLSAALVEAGADTASGEMTVTTPAPTVTIPDDGGNKLGTTATVTPDGVVTITGSSTALNGDLGVGHYLARVDNMQGKTLTVRRSTGAPFQNGGQLNLWQMAWAYDPDGEWFPFDSVISASGQIVATKTAPLTENTVYISRRAAFLNSRWDKALERWKASPYTSPTASGNANFEIGTLPAVTHAPAMPMHGFKFGTGPSAVFMSGTIHVDEGIGAYALEAAVDWLLGNDPAAVAARANATFYAYPKMNPQARHAGASRVEVQTGENANRIFLADGSMDAIHLSKMLRDVWAADLPAKIDGVLDFHDHAFASSAQRGAVYTVNDGGFLPLLQARYLARTGVEVAVEPSTRTGTVTRYVNDTFGAEWATTIEHGTSTADGWGDWAAWGRDVAQSLAELYGVAAPVWITPALTPINGITTAATQPNGDVIVSVTPGGTGSPGVSFPIPEGATIEVAIEITARTNTTRTILRQGPDATVPSATSTELHNVTTVPYSRLQTVTWEAGKPFFGVLNARSVGSQAASFTLAGGVKYRVLSITTPTLGGLTLSAALTEAGADTASGAASVGITASAAMVESGEDTASGEMTVTTPITAQRVIILTDYAGDCDDATALEIACAAHKGGDIEILGVVVTSSIPTSAPGVYGQLRAYGMEGIPVYAYQGSVGTYNNRISAAVRDAFGVPNQTRAAYEDDVTGLRRMLAAAPDASVKMIDIGAPISTSRLLDSPADAISPLTGMELVAAKVIGLWAMAGNFPTGAAEYNMNRDVASSQNVYHNWPTPIYAHGGEVGGNVFTGPGPDMPLALDPVKVAYDSYDAISGLRADGKRYSWDPMTVHHAIYGNGSLYRLGGENGTITIDGTGVSTWSQVPAGDRNYVAKAASVAATESALQAVINGHDLLAYQTGQFPHNRQPAWAFPINEGSGSELRADTGAGATVIGAAWSASPVRLTLNGSSHRIIIPARAAEQDKDFVIGALVRLSNISGVRQILARQEAANNRRFWQFRSNAGALEFVSFTTAAAGTVIAGSAGSVVAGQWLLAVAYVTNTSAQVRANGVEVGSGTFAQRNIEVRRGVPIMAGARIGPTGSITEYMAGDLGGMALKFAATADDIATLEADLRAIAGAKGITLP